jgi:2-polyprenyl-3-methyl-5-hydroxy-6-metoxy-1,4-benzoquinol methylase
MKKRSNKSELIDRTDISFLEFSHCLSSLEKINILTLTYRPTLRWLKRIFRAERQLHILDIGSGGGDMLRRIARMAQRQKKRVELTGVDSNAWSKHYAEEKNQEDEIDYITHDVFSLPSELSPDIIISSLFTHHLNDSDLIRFLKWMHGAARAGWFINDLHRHWIPYTFIRLTTLIFSRNRMIRHDAPISVARAFTRADWQRFLREAKIDDPCIRISWHFPFRYCVSCLKS